MKVERSAILKFNKNDDIDNWFIYHEILSALDKYPDHVFYIDNYRVDGTVEVFQGTQDIETLTVKILNEEYNKSKTDLMSFKNSKTMYESSVKPDCSRLIAVYVNEHQLRLQPGFYAGYYDTHDKEWKIINNDRREEFNDEQISWWTELEFDFNKKDDANFEPKIVSGFEPKIVSGAFTPDRMPADFRIVAVKRKYIPGYFKGYYNSNPAVNSWIIIFSDDKQDTIDDDDIECWYEIENNTNTVISGPVYKFNSPDQTPEDHKDIIIKTKDHPRYRLGYYNRKIEKWVIKAGVRKEVLDDDDIEEWCEVSPEIANEIKDNMKEEEENGIA